MSSLPKHWQHPMDTPHGMMMSLSRPLRKLRMLRLGTCTCPDSSHLPMIIVYTNRHMPLTWLQPGEVSGYKKVKRLRLPSRHNPSIARHSRPHWKFDYTFTSVNSHLLNWNTNVSIIWVIDQSLSSNVLWEPLWHYPSNILIIKNLHSFNQFPFSKCIGKVDFVTQDQNLQHSNRLS